MKKIYFIIALIAMQFCFGQGGAPSCAVLQSNPSLYQSCATNIPFANQSSNSSDTVLPSCFDDPIKAPTWFFMEINASGNINLQISQVSNMGNGIDVDFCLWGPFTSVSNVCGSLNTGNEIDCSWLPDSVESVQLPNAIVGQIYILMVDNYAQIPGQISITQTSGAGSSDCSFLSSVKIKDITNAEIIEKKYCKPATKDLKAIVDASDFTGNPADLRFNFRWKRDNVVIATTNNSVANTNIINAAITGVYKVEIAAYDSSDLTIDINNVPFPSGQSDEINLGFFETAVLNSAPLTIEQCDFVIPNTDGIATFNLTQSYNDITNNTPGITLSFFRDAALTDEIFNPTNYTNSTPFNQTIYVVGYITAQTFLCFSATKSIALKVNPTSTAVYPNINPVCPVLNQNYGLIDFDAQRLLIKNTFFPISTVDIRFYLNANDASIEENQLVNTNQILIGNYTIYTKVKSGNNCSGVGTFLISVKQSPNLTLIANAKVCKNDALLLSSKDNEALLGQNVAVTTSYHNSYLDAVNNVSVINKNTPYILPLGTKTVYVRLLNTITGCFSIINFDVTVFANPAVNPNPDKYIACGNGTAVFNLNSRIANLSNSFNFTVQFFETQNDLNNNNPIATPAVYVSVSKTIFVKVTDPTNNGCSSNTTLVLEVLAKPGNPNNPTPFRICNNTGFASFDLTSKQGEMAGVTPIGDIVFRYYENQIDALANTNNTIANVNSFTNSFKNYQKLFVRINNVNPAQICFNILELEIFASEFPISYLQTSPYKICVDANNVVTEEALIDTKLVPQIYSFVWYNGLDGIAGNEIAGETDFKFSTPNEGNYSVKITNSTTANLCSIIVNFSTKILVTPLKITISPDEIIAFNEKNEITATVTPANAEYEYQLNYGGWQVSSTFMDLRPGVNTVSVRNKFGCNTLTTEVIVAQYLTFFTPNGDSYNDVWKIVGDEALDITNTYIYDKYGKLVYQHKKNDPGWNGTLNGKPLPADDYWFKVVYVNKNLSKEFKGHFSLKR